MDKLPLITILTFAPIAGAVILAIIGNSKPSTTRVIAIITTVFELLLAFVLLAKFDNSFAGFQFVEKYNWIPSLDVYYHVGIDGISLLMILLTCFVVLFSILASGDRYEKSSLYYSLILLIESGLIGTFTTLNFIHWFIFWEISIVPAYFLIKLWGGKKRVEAATQFFIYTLIGSVFLLLAFQIIYIAAHTFEFIELTELGRAGELEKVLWEKLSGFHIFATSAAFIMAIFIAVMLAFLVKVPMFPLHIWLPITYAEAPTPVTMILTGAMSKMGLYGLLRIAAPVFPQQFESAREIFLWLAVATIILGSASALAQKDLKRMFAYSSVNHLGYCLLGIFAISSTAASTSNLTTLTGVSLQILNHSINASAIFYFIGLIENRSGGLRGIEDFGGLRRVMPVLAGLFGISLFASLGLPGLNGFVGEFLIFTGVFGIDAVKAGISLAGLLLTAIFILNVLQKVFSGAVNSKWSGLNDLDINERIIALPAVLLMLLLGLYPQPVINFLNNTLINMRF